MKTTYDPKKHQVISNASCTTNGIAPAVKVLHDTFGITKGLMTTIHSYTNDQRIMDTVHRDLRRARAAALNIIPTTTGAAKAVAQVIPALKGKIHGLAFRVPTPTVSVIDFVCDVEKEVTVEQVNQALKKAAAGALKGILEYLRGRAGQHGLQGQYSQLYHRCTEHDGHRRQYGKDIAWYDNEWGYSCRLGDLALFMANKGV